MTKKIIQSIKVEEADYGKYIYIDNAGNTSFVNPDEEHVAITATTDNGGALSQAVSTGVVSEWLYNLSNFTLSSGSTSNIRGIWVKQRAATNDNGATVGLRASYPWDVGAYQIVSGFGGENDSQSEISDTMCFIPVKPNQYGVGVAELNLQLNATLAGGGNYSYASYTIVGAKLLTK